jgi:hypothetical protein
VLEKVEVLCKWDKGKTVAIVGHHYVVHNSVIHFTESNKKIRGSIKAKFLLTA